MTDKTEQDNKRYEIKSQQVHESERMCELAKGIFDSIRRLKPVSELFIREYNKLAYKKQREQRELEWLAKELAVVDHFEANVDESKQEASVQ